MIELPDGGRLYAEDEEMPTVEELIVVAMTPEQRESSTFRRLNLGVQIWKWARNRSISSTHSLTW